MSEYYKKLYFNSEENNQLMGVEFKKLQQENKQLKEKIDKAIEYIKDGEVEYDDNDDETKEKIYSIYVPTLLEILGGEENERN